MIVTQTNLANTYTRLRRYKDTLRMRTDVYSACLKLYGTEHEKTFRAANNYAASLKDLERFREAKSLLLKTMPVARHVLGDSNDIPIMMRCNYAMALYNDANATLDDLREAVTTLEETTRTARRVLGGQHPTTTGIECYLQFARAALRARETPPTSA